ncbi:ECF RNA polymerase sigma factor SigK [Nocardioides insulae]|uniref:ECF RNA polymerase sigma factor SigK n=1 Tax=Nocardioides insulae TaxID=394734 RepID=UPI000415ADB1|nr:ECF RNA polymerase sigma factor SigK [Nocardioides insulae]
MPRRGLRLVDGTRGADEGLAAVMAAVARGDLGAFERLYDALATAVHAVSRRVVRDPALAEEVTQEVFVEVWRHAGRFDPGRGGVRTWVLTVAHRRAVDAVRSSQAARDRERRASYHEPPPAAGPDEAVAEAEERRGVRRCLDSLTPLQRESVELAYYQGYTYAEVAALLERPLPTIKTRMRDGLIRLRDCLHRGLEAPAEEGAR